MFCMNMDWEGRIRKDCHWLTRGRSLALAGQVNGLCHRPWSKTRFRDDSSSELAKPFSFSIKVVVICFRGLAHINLFRSLHELTVNSPWEGYEEKRREEAIGK